MINNAFTHWKTTLAGAAAAALSVIANGRSGSQIAAAIAMALIGFFAKDSNKQ